MRPGTGGHLTLTRTIPSPHWLALPVAALAGAWMVAVLPPQGLGLRADRVKAGQVRIAWQRSRPVLTAQSAVLEIRDGARVVMVPLTADRLRNSSLTYLEESPQVTVRMRLNPEEQGAPVEEAISIAGPATTGAGAAPDPNTAHLDAVVTPEPPALPAEEPPSVTSAEVLAPPKAEPVAAPSRATPVTEAAREAPEPAPARIVPLRTLQLPPSTRTAAASSAEALPPPPSPLVAPSPGTPPLLATLNLPKPTIAIQPRSGRLIWTGSLDRRGVVEIEGGRATVGSLTGELPGVKVSFRVSPAELLAGGLVVYTSDKAAAGRTEPASKSNGWNATRFQWDAERARQLVVLEAPNPSNEFKRLALRSDARTCSVILVDWSTP